MNIKRAKQEIIDAVEAYLSKDEYGDWLIPRVRQRPILLLGAPGIGKTQIMGQAARECGVALVAYSITHHTRQSAIGLPFISKKQYGGQEYSVTEYTMSEIVASVYDKMEETGLSEEFFSLMRSTACPRLWPRRCSSFCSARPSEIMRFLRAGSSWQQEIRRSTTNRSGISMW